MDEPKKPYWMPDAQGFAIGAIILICAAALFVRMFHTSNADDKMLDTMITILFSTCLVAVFQYLFGSSRGSAAKDDNQTKIIERLAPPPAPVAPVEPAKTDPTA
jgi:cbb3-type cytochrome oxidase subunit 3